MLFGCYVNNRRVIRRYRVASVRGVPGWSEAQITSTHHKTILYNSISLLYNKVMTTMNVSEAREKLAEAIDAAQSEAVVLERYGRPAAVLVSMERYEQLLDALEEAEDISAFDAAMAEEGDNIPWEQVKADLGWS